MSDKDSSLPASPLSKRYLRILRDTIRRELESRVEKHLVEGDKLKEYLKQLGIPSEVSLHRPSLDYARKAIETCGPISNWFNLNEFWKEMQRDFSGAHGTTGYQEILSRLLIRLHGFWVFTLDDTSHTFRFIPSPHEKNEWGETELGKTDKSDPDVEKWPDVRIHLGKGVYYKNNPGMKGILQDALKHYLLRPGEGSVGLGLRADRGVCLRDTVRDLRGAVAIEDCFTRNLSYIGLPVFLQSGGTNFGSLHELGERGRPIGHFGVFFPAPLGWHEPLGTSVDWCEHCTFSSEKCQQKPLRGCKCLYRWMWDLRKEVVQPLVAQNYETQSNERYKGSVGRIAELGDDPKFQNRGVEPDERRRVFLEKLLPSADKAEKTGGQQVSKAPDSTALKIEDFHAVQIWERHAAIAGLSEGTIPASEANYTWRQSVRWNYPDLFLAQLRQTVTEFALKDRDESVGPWERKENGPWHELRKQGYHMTSRRLGAEHQIILVRDKGQTSEPDLDAACTFWEVALQAVDSATVPDSLPEFKQRMEVVDEGDETATKEKPHNSELDRTVCTLKWRRMLRSHLTDCLVTHLIPAKQEADAPPSPSVISDFLFADDKRRWELSALLEKVEAVPEAMVAAILGGADYRLAPDDAVKVGNDLKPVKDRLKFELEHVSHTLSVFLALAHVVRETEMLKSSSTVRFRTNHTQESGHGRDHDWPIQSETDLDAKGSAPTNLHFDCGTETAFSIPAIWQKWWKEFNSGNSSNGQPQCPTPPELDLIEFKAGEGTSDSIAVTLRHAHGGSDASTLNFTLLDNKPAKVFHRVLAFRASLVEKVRHLWESGGLTSRNDSSPGIPERKHSRIWREKDLADKATTEAAGKVALFLAKCRGCNECSRDPSADEPFYIVVAHVANRWMIERRNFREGPRTTEKNNNSGCCKHAPPDVIDAFEHIVVSAGEVGHLLGPDFGLTTHVFVPLSRPVEPGLKDRDVGFMVFSGSQIEHDTIRRVDIRPAQRALAQFAANYLEYAITQELSRHEMTQSLQGFAHASRRTGSYLRIGEAAKWRTKTLEAMAMNTGLERDSSLVNGFVRKFKALPWPGEVTTNIHNFLDASAGIEHLEVQKFRHTYLLTALTHVLLGNAEPPLKYFERGHTIPDFATNIERWITHSLESSIENEQASATNVVIFKIDIHHPPTPRNDALFPAGSLCLVMQELVRNASKYGKPGSERHVRVRFDGPGEASVWISNLTQDSAILDSTGAGIQSIHDTMTANFGVTGWSIKRHRLKKAYGVCLRLRDTFYREKFSNLLSNQ